jgi:hypothetical protein
VKVGPSATTLPANVAEQNTTVSTAAEIILFMAF